MTKSYFTQVQGEMQSPESGSGNSQRTIDGLVKLGNPEGDSGLSDNPVTIIINADYTALFVIFAAYVLASWLGGN